MSDISISRRFLMALIFSVCFITNIQAETEELFVTAQRFPVDINKTLSNVTRIERDQIVASGATDLPSLLALTPSIAISRAGGPGQQTSLFLRGTESDHFLLMVDGVRLASAASGAAALNLIPLESIERIEIVRGPRSSLYGSEALGGVVQIFTSAVNKTGASASLEAGSNNTVNARGAFQYQTDITQASLTIGGTTSDGIDAIVGSDPDDDGHENITITANINYKLNERIRLNGNIFHASGDQEFDDSFDPSVQPRNDFTQQTISAGLTFDASDHWQLGLTVAQGRDELDVSSNFPDFFDTTVDQLKLTARHQKGNRTLLLGYDYRDEELDSQTPYQESSRDNNAIYLNYVNALGAHQFGISLRSDDNQAFGTETTGNIAYSYQFANGLEASITAGTAYKAPSFNDLYFPDFPPFFFANPDLQPEESENVELSLSDQSGNSRWQASIFQNEITDLIAFTGVTSENIAEATIRGLEISASTILADWQIQANASFLDHEDDATGDPLLRRPDTTLNLNASRTFGAWRLNAEVSYNDSRNDVDFSSFPSSIVELDEIWLLNIGASYAITERFTIYGKITNVTDDDQQTIFGFNSPGTEGLIGIRFR